MRAHIRASLVLVATILSGCADNSFTGDIGSGSVTGPGASLTLQLSRDSVSLAPGTVDTLRVSLSNGSNPSTVIWQSSDARVATVSSVGEVMGVSAGTAVVSAVVGESSARAKVTVTGTTPATPPDTTVIAPPSSIVDPELPRLPVDVSMPAVTGQSIRVNAGGDLQAALNAAQPGDEIVVQAGATFTGPFTLPAKSGTGWVVVRSSGTLPAAGTRVKPSDAAQMPKLVSQSIMDPVFQTAPGAHHFRLVGLEITAKAGATQAGALVGLGDGSPAQNTLAQMPHDLVLDRVYVHGTPTLNFQRCVALNSGATAIVDSYISECHGKGFDSQAIAGWNGSGPYRIENNYLEGAGENMMFGGADPQIANMLPRDIVIRRNHFYKPAAWQGVWTVKNLLELKIGQRVLIEGNVFENCWPDAQTGFAVLFKSTNQNGAAPWSETSDVTMQYNIVRNSTHGVSLAGHPEAYPVVPANHIKLANNLFEKIGDGDYPGGRLIQLSNIDDLTLTHNTGFGTSHGLIFAGGPVMAHLVITDNLFGQGMYTITSDVGRGTAALDAFAPGWTVNHNVFVGASTQDGPATGNYFPPTLAEVGFVNAAAGDWHLSPTSQYRTAGSGGFAIGADIDKVTQHTAGVP